MVALGRGDVSYVSGTPATLISGGAGGGGARCGIRGVPRQDDILRVRQLVSGCTHQPFLSLSLYIYIYIYIYIYV